MNGKVINCKKGVVKKILEQFTVLIITLTHMQHSSAKEVTSLS